MKLIARIVIISMAALAVAVQGADRYVVPPGTPGTPTAGFTSWGTAATNIQDAVTATTAGDTVWVTNGTYYLPNQVTVTNFMIKSFNNGALDREGTVINGNNYVGKTVTNRCFTLSHVNALVEGFTITNGFANGGATLNANGNGGGVSLTAGTLRNCLVTGNTASNGASGGGGVYAINASSVITNCDIVGNQAVFAPGLNPGHGAGGGGVKLATAARLANSRILYNNSPVYWTAGGGVHAEGASLVEDCMIVSNKVGQDYNTGGSGSSSLYAWGGGGVWVYGANAATLRSCLIRGNGRGNSDRGGGVGTSGGSAAIENCTIVENVGSGIGASQASTYKLVNVISFYNGAADTSVGGTLNASNCCLSSLANVTSGSGNLSTVPAFVNRSGGNFRLWPWSAGVDAGLSQTWMSTALDLDSQARVSLNGLVDMGAYETTAGPVPLQYVAQGGQTPLPPYTNWVDAASNIQEAVNAVFDGGIILVSNGVYLLTNQVSIGNLTLRSFNNGVVDRSGTIVNGNNHAGKPVTNRCFVLGNAGALVEGFTITNGFAYGSGGIGGGGVYMTAGTLRDCLVTGNLCTNGSGGGVYATGADSIITNCDIVANVAKYDTSPAGGGGGVRVTAGAKLLRSRVVMNNCPRYYSTGGGVHMDTGAFVSDCLIASNMLGAGYGLGSAGNHGWGGGGVATLNAGAGTLRNCVIMGNAPGLNLSYGGGIYNYQGNVLIENCTVVDNVGAGIGSSGPCTYSILNSVVYYNTGGDMNAGGGTLVSSNSCASSLSAVTAGSGNITAYPAFVARAGRNYALVPWSPGVDTGLTLPWMGGATDIAGQPRVSGNGLPDLGAYETTAGSIVTQFVAQIGQTPVSPYTGGWMNAATSLADAVAATPDGVTVLVSNGTYALNGQIEVGNFTIRSFKDGGLDRDGTLIDGNNYAGKPVTNRCFYLNHPNAVVEGLTITNGRLTGANNGGGVYINHGTLKGCLVTGNTISNNVDAAAGGGGIYAVNLDSLITNCDVVANVAKANMQGGGVYLDNWSQMWGGRVLSNQGGSSPSSGAGGGGVRLSMGTMLCGAVVASNTSAYQGGGVAVYGTNSIVRNCLVRGNTSLTSSDNAGVVAITLGGVVPRLENCTVVGNAIKVPYSGGNIGLMAAFVNVLHDSAIVWGNVPSNGVLTNCVFTTTNGFVNSSGNIATNNPRFANAAAGDYRLHHLSPCIGAGANQTWMIGATDLDGNSRISPLIGGTVDIGAYEYQIQSGTSFILR